MCIVFKTISGYALHAGNLGKGGFMKKLLLATTMMTLAMAIPAKADSIIGDPLHGMVCSGPGGTGCSNSGDNGSFTPLGSVANWAFSVSPGPQTGNLTLVFGVPTDEINPATFLLPGLTDNGGGVTTNVFSRVSFFNAGTPLLATYLGLGSFSPTDSFSNMSAGTSAADPGFGGNFLVFTATIPGITLNDTSSTTALNDFSFGNNLPAGTFIDGLFVTPTENIATAASAHLVVQPLAVPGPIAGAGIPGLIGACGTMLMLGRRRFKKWRGAI
jgi:hypothetical protein